MDLTKTQIQVLKVLIDNKNRGLTDTKISKLGNINLHHVRQALTKFMECDYVYQPTINGEFKISLDGESAYCNL